jgi:hypothetical protein
MLGTILIVILVMALLGVLPRWSIAGTGAMPLQGESDWFW